MCGSRFLGLFWKEKLSHNPRNMVCFSATLQERQLLLLNVCFSARNSLSKTGSTLKEKSLLLGEQLLSFMT